MEDAIEDASEVHAEKSVPDLCHPEVLRHIKTIRCSLPSHRSGKLENLHSHPSEGAGWPMHHSGLIPAALSIGHHFSISVWWNASVTPAGSAGTDGRRDEGTIHCKHV